MKSLKQGKGVEGLMGRRKSSKPVTPSVDLASFGAYEDSDTIGHILIKRLKDCGSYTRGVSVPPCAIIWTDPEEDWKTIIEDLKQKIPELYEYGPYEPEIRRGPAIWLKCIEARTIPVNHAEGAIPIFYLPSVSLKELKDAENCPVLLQPLVEYLYRGSSWHHPNGRDWTLFAFLSSDTGGLGFDISKDEDTKNALKRTLLHIIEMKAKDLSGNNINSAFINHLLTPDFPRDILKWMNNPEKIQRMKSEEEWLAFTEQLEREYEFNPEKDGENIAAELLAQRKGLWRKVWGRFTEAPGNYPGIIKLLRAVDVPDGVDGSELESYPAFNDKKEKELADALKNLKDQPRDKVIQALIELDKNHGYRRDWIWVKEKQAQFVLALDHLIKLSIHTKQPMNAASSEELAELYVTEGWKADNDLINALMCCTTPNHEGAIREIAHIIYYDWLDTSSKNIQSTIKREKNKIKPKLDPVEAVNGRIIVFVDGLRFDIARILKERLQFIGHNVELSWDWSPIPTITQTAKYFVTPIQHLLEGDAKSTDLTPQIKESHTKISPERLDKLLRDNGTTVIDDNSIGNIDGKVWTETANIDHKGHQEGWKIVQSIEKELSDIIMHIDNLLEAGWREILVVTDHGWVMVPMYFTKEELPKKFTELEWGRCALPKESVDVENLIPWHWNELVYVSSPHGVSCYREKMQYTHGGISLQELVVPRLMIKNDVPGNLKSKISGHRWVGMRCIIDVSNPNEQVVVDIRLRVKDPETSLLEGKAPKGVSEDGMVSIPIPNTDDEGKKCFIVLLDKDGNDLDKKSTKVGGET
jgi:hypothetical protein